MTFETPMLFAIGLCFLFTIGGFTGLMLAFSACGLSISGYLFCGGAFPLCISSGVIFALLAATYYWLPKWTGHMYNET